MSPRAAIAVERMRVMKSILPQNQPESLKELYAVLAVKLRDILIEESDQETLHQLERRVRSNDANRGM